MDAELFFKCNAYCRWNSTEIQDPAFVDSVNSLFSYEKQIHDRLRNCIGLVMVGRGPTGGKFVAKSPVQHTPEETFDEEGFEAEMAAYLHMQTLDGTVPKLLGWMIVDVQRPYGAYGGGSRPTLVLEYVEGRLLNELPTSELTPDLLGKVKDAFMQVHACGVVQGDPRLQNVVVRGTGEVCVIDFGRAVLDPSEQLCEQELAQLDDMWEAAITPVKDVPSYDTIYA